MKTLIETDKHPLDECLGKRVQVWCLNYTYTGNLKSYDERELVLTEPAIVYETGPFNEDGFSDEQETLDEWRVISRSAIESYALVK